jgi:hypothetical protein
METVEELRDELRRLYGPAFAARQHEIAYHILAALLHAGETLRSVEVLDEIEGLARRHLTRIDLEEPKHLHSSRSADSRGNPSIFAHLAVTAAAARARVKAELLLEKQEQKRRPKAPLS